MSIMWSSLSYVPKLNEELADNVAPAWSFAWFFNQAWSLGAKLGVIRSLPFGSVPSKVTRSIIASPKPTTKHQENKKGRVPTGSSILKVVHHLL